MKKQTDREVSERMITPTGICSHPALFEPDTYMGSDPKYKVDLLLSKNDPAVVEWVKATCKAMHQMAQKVWPGVKWQELKNPFNNGDEKEGTDSYKGHWYIIPKSKYAPDVVLQDKSKATEGDVYAGCKIRLSVYAYTYKSGKDKGVTFRLGNVQKVAEGQPFGGMRSRGEDDFDTVDFPVQAGVDESSPFDDSPSAPASQVSTSEDYGL